MVSIKSSNSSSVIFGGNHPTNEASDGPQSVALTLRAKKAGLDGHTDVDLASHTQTGNAAQNVSLHTASKTGKVDFYNVKVGLGDWTDKPGDADDIAFLICISGAKGGPAKAPFLPDKEAREVDFRCDINLKGLPLKAKLKNGLDKDLKLVKCLDADGKPAWGYLGTADDAKELLKFSFTSPKGKEVAKLAIDISGENPSDHDGFFHL
jgi:hypothetical protein